MKDIAVKFYFEINGTSYYIDENGWSYIQKETNGPLELIKTVRLKWHQKIWFKIKYMGKNYVLVGNIKK